MEIRLLVAESNTLLRQGVIKLVTADRDISVVGEANTGMQAVEKTRELKPDAVIVNRRIAGLDGIDVTRLIAQEVPSSRVVVLSFSDVPDENEVLEAVRAGARGYVNTNVSASSLIQHVKQVVAGGVALTEEATRKLIDCLAKGTASRSATEPADLLTEREKCVLDHICQGARNKGIASDLVISENTVRAHVRSLMQKLNSENRTQLAIYGVRYGFGKQERQPQPTQSQSGWKYTPPPLQLRNGNAGAERRLPALAMSLSGLHAKAV